MKKSTLIILITSILVVITSSCLIIALGKDDGDKLQTFKGIVFNDLTLDYDGEEHTIVATQVPEGATVSYTDAGPYKNAGEYSFY